MGANDTPSFDPTKTGGIMISNAAIAIADILQEGTIARRSARRVASATKQTIYIYIYMKVTCSFANHFAAKCLSLKKKPINTVGVESDDSDSDVLIVSISKGEQSVMHVTQGKQSGKIFTTMQIDNRPVRMLVDSGASCNVIPAKYVPKSTPISCIQVIH